LLRSKHHEANRKHLTNAKDHCLNNEKPNRWEGQLSARGLSQETCQTKEKTSLLRDQSNRVFIDKRLFNELFSEENTHSQKECIPVTS
jgi:hypothetical protein